MIVTVPVKTINELNATGWHWRKRQKYREGVRLGCRNALTYIPGTQRRRGKPTLPVHVKMTRLSAGTLDDDGLGAALKSVKDEVAAWLGVDDGPDDDRVTWERAQEKCKRGQYAVRIEIEERGQ